MKKIIVFLFLCASLILFKSDDSTYINNAIRYRIIANSDNFNDQKIKWDINREIIPIINKMDSSSKDKMSSSIIESIPHIDSIVSKYTSNYSINYGDNYFPKKEYHNVTYEEGYYPSLVITLGNSDGHNWWCFMFPPLCALEASKDEISDVKYEFYFKKIINKYI